MTGNAAPKRAYSFKEGLAMMAAKDVGVDPYLAADAADTAVAHLEPGEMVVPRAVLTPELAQLIAAEAAKRGIDPRQLFVGSRNASINSETGAEEFGWFGDLVSSGVNKVKGLFGRDGLANPEIEPITVSATRRPNSVWLSGQGEEVPGTKFSRMIPAESGAEGRMFTDDEVERNSVDLYGPFSSLKQVDGRSIRNYTDNELSRMENEYRSKSAGHEIEANVAAIVPIPIVNGLVSWNRSQHAGDARDTADGIKDERHWRSLIRAYGAK